MWTLDFFDIHERGSAWVTLGTFASVTSAARFIRDREGKNAEYITFFIDFESIKDDTDPDYLEHQALSGSYALYSDKPRELKT